MSYKRLHSRIKGTSQSHLEQVINAFQADGPAPKAVFTPDISHPSTDYGSEIEAIRKVNGKLGLTFERLNTQQRHAVFHPCQHAILSAMVGSGKTTVLIAKVFYLHFIKGVPFSEMVVLTFTNKAAREIKERIATFLNTEDAQLQEELRYFGTFHSVARQLLQEHPKLDELGFKPNFMIMDELEKQHFLERLIAQHELNIKYRNKLSKRWRNYKREGISKMGNMKNEDDFVQLVALAQQEKQAINTMDFDDLTAFCNQLMKEHSPTSAQWIIVDEFQDCNEEQLQLIEHLKGERTQLFVVGDQNQSIYGWRGSKEHLFEETQQRWNTTWMELPQNYRSTKTILTAAETLLQSDQSALIATRHSGTPIDLVRHFDDQQEAYYLKEQLLLMQKDNVSLDKVAILFRTHQQIAIVETVLQQASIPHQLVKRSELHEDVTQRFFLNILKVCINNDDIDACLAFISDANFGVMKRSQSVIRQLKGLMSKGTSALEATIHYLKTKKTPSSAHINLLEKSKVFIRDFASQQDTEPEHLIHFLGLRELLKPTSIHHQEYMASIAEAWTQLLHYAHRQGGGKLAKMLPSAIDQVVLEGTFQINDRIKEEGHGVHLLTIHASKGLEFDSVFIAGANTGIIPLTQHKRGNENIQEEKRLLFVAITRGKNKVEIGWHTQPTMRNTESTPSYFLNNVPESLLHRRTAKDDTAPTQDDEWTVDTNVTHKKYGSGKITTVDEKALICTFDAVGEKTFSRAFAKALLTIVE